MFYTADNLERLDRVYFTFPVGWHVVQSKDRRFLADILIVEVDGKKTIKECTVRRG